MKARFLKSLVIGAAIAAALVAYEGRYRRAALMASAARSGGHQTLTSILASGFVGVTLIAGLVVFVLATVRARRRGDRRRQRQDSLQPRRRRADAWR